MGLVVATMTLSKCRLLVVDSAGRPIDGTSANFTFMRPRGATPTRTVTLAGAAIEFNLNAFPNGEGIFCQIDVPRYRSVKSGFMLIAPDREFEQRVVAPRNPRSWKPAFQPWNDLSEDFESLKTTLENS